MRRGEQSKVGMNASMYKDGPTPLEITICSAFSVRKLRTWVRFPSPAPETFPSDNLAIGRGGKRRH